MIDHDWSKFHNNVANKIVSNQESNTYSSSGKSFYSNNFAFKVHVIQKNLQKVVQVYWGSLGSASPFSVSV